MTFLEKEWAFDLKDGFISDKMTQKQINDKLNAHNGILRQKLRYLGLKALVNVIVNPRENHISMMDALIDLRNGYLEGRFGNEKYEGTKKVYGTRSQESYEE